MGRKPASFVNTEDYISANEAAHIKSVEYGRCINPCRINKFKNVRRLKINSTQFWYNRGDIENYKIRDRRMRCRQCGLLDCSGHQNSA